MWLARSEAPTPRRPASWAHVPRWPHLPSQPCPPPGCVYTPGISHMGFHMAPASLPEPWGSVPPCSFSTGHQLQVSESPTPAASPAPRLQWTPTCVLIQPCPPFAVWCPDDCCCLLGGDCPGSEGISHTLQPEISSWSKHNVTWQVLVPPGQCPKSQPAECQQLHHWPFLACCWLFGDLMSKKTSFLLPSVTVSPTPLPTQAESRVLVRTHTRQRPLVRAPHFPLPAVPFLAESLSEDSAPSVG